jgi:hypothetical protein
MPKLYVKDGLIVGDEGALVQRLRGGTIDVDSPALTSGYDTVVLALPGLQAGNIVQLFPPEAYAAAFPQVTPVAVEATGADELTVGMYNGSGGGLTGTNEQQTVTASGATSGDFTLSFKGQATAAIQFDDSAATVQGLLEGLSTIGAGNVSVSGTDVTSGLTVEFIVDLAGAAQPLLVATDGTIDDPVIVAETVAGDGWNTTGAWQYLQFDLTP